jgi:hypothetical protein
LQSAPHAVARSDFLFIVVAGVAAGREASRALITTYQFDFQHPYGGDRKTRCEVFITIDTSTYDPQSMTEVAFFL